MMRVSDRWWARLNREMTAKGELPASAEEAFDVAFLPPKEAAQALSSDRQVLGHRPPLGDTIDAPPSVNL